jgi:hypothetical protein
MRYNEFFMFNATFLPQTLLVQDKKLVKENL